MCGSAVNLTNSDVFSAFGAAHRGAAGETLAKVAPSPTVTGDDLPMAPPFVLVGFDAEQRIIFFDSGAADIFGCSAAKAPRSIVRAISRPSIHLFELAIRVTTGSEPVGTPSRRFCQRSDRVRRPEQVWRIAVSRTADA